MLKLISYIFSVFLATPVECTGQEKDEIVNVEKVKMFLFLPKYKIAFPKDANIHLDLIFKILLICF